MGEHVVHIDIGEEDMPVKRPPQEESPRVIEGPAGGRPMGETPRRPVDEDDDRIVETTIV